MSVPELMSKLQMRTRRRAARTRLRDLGIDLQTAAGRKHHAHRGGSTGKREWHAAGLDFAGLFEVLLLPQFLEITRVIIGQCRRLDFNDVVLHQGKSVIRDVE